MPRQDDLLSLTDALNQVVLTAGTAAAAASRVDRADMRDRLNGIKQYASEQSTLLHAVLSTPQEEKRDERTPADS